MLFEHIAALTPAGILQDCFVATQGAFIAYVGRECPQGDFGEAYDGRGRLLLPGFVNAHSHTPMTLMRGYGENLVLSDWLNTRIFPFEDLMRGEDIYWASLLGIAEMVRYGITSTSDMYYKLDDMARAFSEAGVKINLSNGAVNLDGTPYAQLRSTKETHAAIADWHGAADGLIRVDFSLHAEYTSDEATVRAVAEDAAKHGLRMQVHVSETQAEHEACKQRRGGKTPVEYLSGLGLLDVPATAAHCVWIEAGDRDILREKGVCVASCPKSNLKLASGVFDARAAMDAGVPFALGTDSVASNNSLNMVEEIRTFLLAQKGFSGDPTLVTPQQAFAAASRAGALSQGREDCGEIREGMRADLCVMDISMPQMQPTHDLMANLGYSASGSDIVLTLCDGRIVYRDGAYPTIDVARACDEVNRACGRITGELSRKGGGA